MKTFFTLLTIVIFSNAILAQEDTIKGFPEKYVLLNDEIPDSFQLKIIGKEIISKGFLGNPGYITDELREKAFTEQQKQYFSDIYLAVYINLATQVEIVLTIFKLNTANVYFDGILQVGNLLIDDYSMVVISSYNAAETDIDFITKKLIKRTNLRLVEHF